MRGELYLVGGGQFIPHPFSNFLIFKCKISKIQKFLPVAPSFLIDTFSDSGQMQGVK